MNVHTKTVLNLGFNVENSVECNVGTPNSCSSDVNSSKEVKPAAKCDTVQSLKRLIRHECSNFPYNVKNWKHSIYLVYANQVVDWSKLQLKIQYYTENKILLYKLWENLRFWVSPVVMMGVHWAVPIFFIQPPNYN